MTGRQSPTSGEWSLQRRYLHVDSTVLYQGYADLHGVWGVYMSKKIDYSADAPMFSAARQPRVFRIFRNEALEPEFPWHEPEPELEPRALQPDPSGGVSVNQISEAQNETLTETLVLPDTIVSAAEESESSQLPRDTIWMSGRQPERGLTESEPSGPTTVTTAAAVQLIDDINGNDPPSTMDISPHSEPRDDAHLEDHDQCGSVLTCPAAEVSCPTAVVVSAAVNSRRRRSRWGLPAPLIASATAFALIVGVSIVVKRF